jgi:predicted metal-binding protein
MDRDHIAWCHERLAQARNELQILAGGRRYRIEDRDVTDKVLKRANEDVLELERVLRREGGIYSMSLRADALLLCERAAQEPTTT